MIVGIVLFISLAFNLVGHGLIGAHEPKPAMQPLSPPMIPHPPQVRDPGWNQTDWPVWWFAPFFDHGSFGKEAATTVLGMVRQVKSLAWSDG